MRNPLNMFWEAVLSREQSDFVVRKWSAATVWFIIGVAVGYFLAPLIDRVVQ